MRRQVGGRCRKWVISTQQTSGKRECAASCVCGQPFSHGEARLQQWCNRNSHCAYVHVQCVNWGIAHDQELLPKHSTDQHAVETVIRQRECVRAAADTEVSCHMVPTRIKPPLRHPLMTIRTSSVVRRLFAWTKKSWTSSGSTQSRGTTSKIFEVPRTFNLRHRSSLRCSKRSMPFFVPSCITIPPPCLRNQHGKRLCSAAGSSWDGLLSMRRRATARTTWKPGSISSGQKIGQPFGPWHVRSVTLLLSTVQHAEQQQNKNSHASVR